MLLKKTEAGMLRLTEKDLADETATKLIFRGNLAALAGARPEKKD